MKKLVILLLCFLPLVMMAETKVIKIAILETIDKANAVEYGKRLLVRSTLAEAITATPGFEAYDRVDLSTIFNEQDFQRTGNVSNDQIKQLGRMTGAQYIMVPEIAKIDFKTYYITAKILDVETAQTISISNATASSEVSSMQNACSQVASRLLTMTSQNQGIQTTAYRPKSTSNPQVNNIGDVHASELGITHEGKYFYIDGERFSRMAVNKITIEHMKNNDLHAYEHYKTRSQKLLIAGWSLFGGGLLLTGFVGPLCFLADEIPAIVLMPLGAGIVLTAATPCLVYGYRRQYACVEKYLFGKPFHPQYASTMPNSQGQPYVTFGLTSSANGLGVVMNF